MAPEGRQVGSLKRLVRERCGQMREEKLHAVVVRSTFQVKMYNTLQLPSTFRSCDVEKVHAVVARSTFPSKHVQTTSCSDHFWKLRCRKSARLCGAKHISKSKVQKTDGYGARLCGAKHISKSKVQKTDGYGALLDVQVSFAWQAQGIRHLVKSEQNVRVL